MISFGMNDGHQVPAIGLGTYQGKEDIDSSKLVSSIKDAIDAGFRHFDCAYVYRCESQVGQAIQEKIQEGVIRREEVFVVSKLWMSCSAEKDVPACCRKSLDNFGLDYLDLYLVHTPVGLKHPGSDVPSLDVGTTDVDYLETWRGMEKCVGMGLARSIGVSNFNVNQLQRLLDHCNVPPAMNQVECHPYMSQKELLQFCTSKGILMTAYCPLGGTNRKAGKHQLMDEPVLLQLAQKHGKSQVQVILRWLIQRHVIPIPKSASSVHMRDNLKVFDFELTKEDMDSIESLNKNERVVDLPWIKGHRFYPFN